MRPRSRSAPSSGSSAPSTIRAVSVAKYQPPLSTSPTGPSAIDPAVGEQHDALGERGGELRVVRGDEHRAAGGGGGAQRPRQGRPSPRGPCRASARRGTAPRGQPARPARPIPVHGARHDRERQALALAAREIARVAVGERAEAGGLERGGAELAADAVGEEVVVGVLQQQRDATGCVDAAAGGREQAVGVAQERRLAGAVAAHQRDALTRREREVDAPQDRAPAGALVPDAAKGERGC